MSRPEEAGERSDDHKMPNTPYTAPLTEQRVREIVREEIARIVSALDYYSEDGIVRVSTLRDVLTRGRP